jgi:hypothetical protein
MSELLIRPSHNDHRLIESLLTTSSEVRQLRPVINRLVVDAQVAVKQPLFAQAAEASGTPLLIDPLTFFFQAEMRSEDPWRQLPFAYDNPLSAQDLEDPELQEEIIANVIEFEIQNGATGLIAPYVLLNEDPRLLQVNRSLLRGTRDYMEAHDLPLPLVPVFAMLASRTVAGIPLRRVLELIAEDLNAVGASSVALAVSGTGTANDSPDRVQMVLFATTQLTSAGLNVIAWRQGLLGPVAVASGAAGYECGIGIREQCDLVSLQRSRRPGPRRSSFAPPAGVFIQPLGRSFSRAIAKALLDDQKLRPRLVCDNEGCCPKGSESMLIHPRPHAVFSRSRALSELDRMPSREWRLNAVAREAESGAVLADLASRILLDGGRSEVINSRGLNSIALAADLVREEGNRAAS